MGAQTRTVEMIVGEIAGRQWGVVARRQIEAAGLTRNEIARLVRKGALLRVHRGVYRVGHRAPSVEATHLAAVLACGEGAVLSGRAAGYLWGLLRGKPPEPEVTALKERNIPGLRVKRAKRLDGTTRCGIPITTVPRTLVDLAASLSFDELARAAHEAGVRYRTTPKEVDRVLSSNTPAAKNLRRVLRGEAKVTLSVLEKRFVRLLQEHHLPLPETNRLAGGRRVDCRWPAHRLTVELDSYRYHASRHAWELDRRRERDAHARGDHFRRYTYDDVTEDPKPMLRELRALLLRT